MQTKQPADRPQKQPADRPQPTLVRKLGAELVGTFILVFAGTGAAVLSMVFGVSGIGILGISLAFGFAALVGVYAFGPISGGHLNPAVTLGLAIGRRCPWRDVLPYFAAQVAGAIVGSAAIWAVAQGAPTGYDPRVSGLAANGFGVHSPGGFGLGSAFLVETLLTFVFVMVVVMAVANKKSRGFAGLAIGLALALTNLVSIPVTNASINPARATGPALFVGGWALAQLWVFWVAPLLGGAGAGIIGRWLLHEWKTPRPARVERRGAERAEEVPPREPLPA